jgi:hypothetical protein
MLVLVLVGLAVWAVLAAIACLSVCMASARFHREAGLATEDYEPSLTAEPVQPARQARLAAQRSQS